MSNWHTDLPLGLPSDFDWSLVRTPDDAVSLICHLPNQDRGKAALALHQHRALVGDRAAYSGIMAAWDHDHVETFAAFGSQDAFASALLDVAPAPRRPRKQTMRCWRGVAVKTDAAAAAFGVSWTRNRDIACWFAFRFALLNLRPFVFRCDIDPGAIVALHNDRGEREVLVDPSQLRGEQIFIDGTDCYCDQFDPDSRAPNSLLNMWHEAAQRNSRRMRSREKQRVARQLHPRSMD